MDSGPLAVLKRSMLEIGGQLLLTWTDTMTSSWVGTCLAEWYCLTVQTTQERARNRLPGEWVSYTVKFGANKWGGFWQALFRQTSQQRWGPPWEGNTWSFCWCCIWGADGFRMSLDKIIMRSKWAPFWQGLSVDHLYITQDEQLLRPESPNTSRISETRLGLHGGTLVQQSQEPWHLCVITTAGVALFTCQLIITGFHLLALRSHGVL